MKNKRKRHNNSKRIDLILILLSPIAASILCFVLQANLLLSIVFFFVLPSIYLSLKNPSTIRRTALFALIFGVIAGTLVDFLASYGGDWFVPTIFPFRIFGYVAFEDLIWGFFLFYLLISFYEYFFDTKDRSAKNKNLKFFLVVLIVLYSLFFPLFFFQKELLNIPYFYLVGGTVLILVPLVVFMAVFPRFINRFLLTGLFFFVQGIIYEITALSLGHWTFEGHEYIGWVEIMGRGFPFEEFIFWFLLFAASALSYYEFFYDDQR